MADPTERYNKLIDEENKRLHRLARGAEIPRYSPKDEKLTPEQEKQDYLMAKTSGGFQQRLREGKQQFGLVQAVDDFVEWVLRND